MRSPTRSAATTWPRLRDELGDLQLQVVFHARMAEEAGAFDLDDVMAAICDKIDRRHPHIFGDAPTASPRLGSAQGRRAREPSRRQERARRRRPRPARARSAPRSSSAAPRAPASTGPTSTARKAKIDEELAEIDAPRPTPRRAEDELGDLLFAVVNFARHLNIDPEDALREANRKFETRFRAIEVGAGLRRH